MRRKGYGCQMTNLIKKLKKLCKKNVKKTRKNTKKLSKQLYGKKGLTMGHSFVSEVSFFGNGKDGKPYLTLSRSGSYKISVFKLAVIILSVVSTAVLVGLLIKAVSDRAKAEEEAENGLTYYGDEDIEELPF